MWLVYIAKWLPRCLVNTYHFIQVQKRKEVFFPLRLSTFRIYSLSDFQICCTVALTTVTLLCITSPGPVYFIMESLYLWPPSPNSHTYPRIFWIDMCITTQSGIYQSSQQSILKFLSIQQFIILTMRVATENHKQFKRWPIPHGRRQSVLPNYQNFNYLHRFFLWKNL